MLQLHRKIKRGAITSACYKFMKQNMVYCNHYSIAMSLVLYISVDTGKEELETVELYFEVVLIVKLLQLTIRINH